MIEFKAYCCYIERDFIALNSTGVKMEVLSVDFELTAIIELNGIKVGLTPFKEHDPNVIKIGVDAPKCLTVNREEIHIQMLKKKQAEEC